MNNDEIGNNFNEKDIQDISDISSDSGSVSSNEAQNDSNNVAVAGFILSLIGLHIVGLILSIVGLKKSKEKNNKGKGLSIAGIVISSIGIIFIAIIIAVLLISIKDVTNSAYDAKNDSVINTYKMIKKSAEQNIMLSSLGDTNITCTKDNCYENYNYNKEYFDVMITDKGTYYELEIDAIGDFSNVNLNDRCNDLEATCMGNTIIGKINKE